MLLTLLSLVIAVMQLKSVFNNINYLSIQEERLIGFVMKRLFGMNRHKCGRSHSD